MYSLDFPWVSISFHSGDSSIFIEKIMSLCSSKRAHAPWYSAFSRKCCFSSCIVEPVPWWRWHFLLFFGKEHQPILPHYKILLKCARLLCIFIGNIINNISCTHVCGMHYFVSFCCRFTVFLFFILVQCMEPVFPPPVSLRLSNQYKWYDRHRHHTLQVYGHYMQ